MLRRWIIPLVVLPGSVLGLVPFVLGVILRDTAHAFVPAPTGSRAFFFAIALAGPGLLLAAGSMSLFFRFGDGTAAPWDPPAKLVVRGLYRHVRNPMLTGVFFLIAAEASFFQSLPYGGLAMR